MVQELVSGRTLAFMQDAFVQAGAPMPPAASTYIVICLLKALDYIHRAKVGESGATIVHRDVNPANILLVDRRRREADRLRRRRGRGRDARRQRRAARHHLVHEPRGGAGPGGRSPRRSLRRGVILWELLTDMRLFAGNSEMEMMHKVRDCRVLQRAALQHRGARHRPRRSCARRCSPIAASASRSAAEFQKALEVLARRNGWPMTRRRAQAPARRRVRPLLLVSLRLCATTPATGAPLDDVQVETVTLDLGPEGKGTVGFLLEVAAQPERRLHRHPGRVAAARAGARLRRRARGRPRVRAGCRARPRHAIQEPVAFGGMGYDGRAHTMASR